MYISMYTYMYRLQTLIACEQSHLACVTSFALTYAPVLYYRYCRWPVVLAYAVEKIDTEIPPAARTHDEL